MKNIKLIFVFSMFSALNTFAQDVNKSDSLVSDEIDLQEVVVSEKLIKREADKFIVDAIRLRMCFLKLLAMCQVYWLRTTTSEYQDVTA